VTHTPECQAFEADLSALIDGELVPEREARVRAHLTGCAACSGRLEALRRVDLALADLPQPAVSPRLAQQLSNRLRELEEAAGAGAQRAQARRARSEAEPSEAGARKARERRRAPARIARRWLSARAAIASAAAAAALALWFSLRGAEEPGPGAQVARAPAEIREPAPAPAPAQVAQLPPAPEPRPAAEAPVVVAEQRPAEAPAAPELGDLQDQDVLLLMRLDEVEDLDLLANLELLEAMVAANQREGSG
jgi:hypothetical protein